MSGNRESEQVRSLRRHRWTATLMLVAMAIVFATTFLPAQPAVWVRFVRAAAEAGLVGGLADWFAVTALFRRPMGLPIPHTAIVPRNKERIGQGLGRFVERNFLAPDLVTARLRQADPAAILGHWLSRRRNSELAAARLLDAAPYLLSGLGDQHVRTLFREGARTRLRRLDLQPLTVQMLRMLVTTPYYQEMVDRLLATVRDLLRANEQRIYTAVSERSRWWVPEQVDRRLAESVVAGLEGLLDELLHRGHPVRSEFDRSVEGLIDHLERSPVFARELELVRERLLASEALSEQLDRIWDELRETLARELAMEESRLRGSLAAALTAVGRTLQEDPAARGRLNEQLEAGVLRFVIPFRAEIGRFMADVVRGWDTRTVTGRLELAVGRDLQYIRMNGTLVGALVGAVLFVLVHLLPY